MDIDYAFLRRFLCSPSFGSWNTLLGSLSYLDKPERDKGVLYIKERIADWDDDLKTYPELSVSELVRMPQDWYIHELATHLDLSGQELGLDELWSLACMKGFKNLKVLNLERNKICDEALEALTLSESIQNLHTLKLSDNPIHSEGLCALAKSSFLASIHTLSLSGTCYQDEGFQALLSSEYTKQIASLDLGYPECYYDGDYTSLSLSTNFPRLERLILDGTDILGGGALALIQSHCFTLKSLSLHNCEYVWSYPPSICLKQTAKHHKMELIM